MKINKDDLDKGYIWVPYILKSDPNPIIIDGDGEMLRRWKVRQRKKKLKKIMDKWQ